jgi:ribonuclease HI
MSGGWGCICRHENDVVRFASAGRIATATDALHAETLFKAVEIADDLGVSRVVFETDCLVLKQALVSRAYDYSPLGILFS